MVRGKCKVVRQRRASNVRRLTIMFRLHDGCSRADSKEDSSGVSVQ